MSGTLSNYNHTVIYKLQSKFPEITKVYIGHTTNMKQRFYRHSYRSKYMIHSSLYDYIRETGGIENWDMIELHRAECKDRTEAIHLEQKYINEHDPGTILNKNKSVLIKSEEATIKEKEYQYKYRQNNKQRQKELQAKYYLLKL